MAAQREKANRLGVVHKRVLEVRGKLLGRLVGEAVAEAGEELVARQVLHNDPLALHSTTYQPFQYACPITGKKRHERRNIRQEELEGQVQSAVDDLHHKRRECAVAE